MELNFNFKGERNYIQGPDVYNALLPLINQDSCKNFDLSFHQIMTQNILLSNEIPKNLEDLYFICKFQQSNIEQQIYGIKNIKSKPIQRYPYPEEQILENAKIDFNNKTISLNKATNFSFMEEIIALNKFLLQTIIQKETPGKWYFSKLQTKRILKRSYPLMMQFKSNFNSLLVKSEIFTPDNGGGDFLFFGSKK
ncbi:hypothetical protein [Campylobacter jejuni]|uniref:hypothetical protein n=1 Tax=Campylobacter jejuni TaxID=197 RepID=UPI0006997D5C|nr:hypothetical protein [Campylobacter jejuni]BEK05896.1 hypothetical protein B10666_12890 [Campylobacter jejuni]HDV6485523.1 hypothetical protein [Campylobacter jejuni]